MKKQLVFYVSKIKNHNGKIFFRFIPNTPGEHAGMWFTWDEQRKELDDTEGAFFKLKCMLSHFHIFTDFKLQFQSETSFFASNPYSKSKRDYLDYHLKIEEDEVIWWRKLMLDLCIKKL